MPPLSRRRFAHITAQMAAATCWGARSALAAVAPPPPYGALPSARQLRWHRLETYAFLHFGINTFTGKEWGYGDEDPSLFDPLQFDADAIVSALKAGGMTAVILTCKHHDGFCLWPTQTTGHSLRHSRWRSGRGDVVRELSDAARRQQLKFGVYLSPWDRNHALYGRPEYIAVYRAQLRELLTQYGPIQEVWHDGANGGDGYYGGARERRTIDKRTYYDWPGTWALVRSLQPDAVIFSDVGPDLRWVGNEHGVAGDPCWETYDPLAPDGGAAAPGLVREQDSQIGTRNGTKWMPPECDVSIRPGWFWRESETARVKTPPQLMDLYFRSVGRGGSLLLNVPPDRRGLLDAADVRSLAAFGAHLRATFQENLAAGAAIKATNERAPAFSAQHLLDADPDTYWATADAVTTPTVEIALPRAIRFNVIRLREAIQLGQRIDAFEIDRWAEGGWTTFARGSSIGACRLFRSETAVAAQRIRLRITQAAACPAISEFGLFLDAA